MFRGAGRRRRRRAGRPAGAERPGAAWTGGRTGHGRRDAEGFGVAEVGVDRRHDDASFDRDEVDAHERDPDPGVDDDALVEDPVEDIDEAGATCGAFDWHSFMYPSPG